jgi:hypothetical protein
MSDPLNMERRVCVRCCHDIHNGHDHLCSYCIEDDENPEQRSK